MAIVTRASGILVEMIGYVVTNTRPVVGGEVQTGIVEQQGMKA